MLAEIPPLGADVLKSATGQLPKLPTCACRNYPPFADFPKSVTGHIVTCACRNFPSPVCRFSKICHWTDTYMCLLKCPPRVLIFQNLPLDSYLSYQLVLAEILPVCRFSEIGYWTDSNRCLQKFSPQFADFPKSATGQIPTCASRNSPRGADFPKSATGQLPKLPTCACRNPPQFVDFPNSATGQIPTCACRNFPPSLQIFQNLPLDSYLSYLHVLAEIPPSLQIFQNL